MRPLNISGSGAKDYYYSKDVIFGSKDNSEWHGAIAEQFGLSGQCREPDFLNIIAGNDLQGNQIIRDGVNKEHRAAIDIPFAAPKSVSVLALHVGDNRMIEAHQKAVKATIDYIERHYLYARKTVDNATTAFKTENGLFATFLHSTSRANDPHLHTHTLTMNMTQTDAGWRATFNDRIFQDQTLLNYVYQSELAKNVRELGFGITNGSKGKWEIAGFKDAWVEHFSTRSNEIDEALEHIADAEKEADARTRDRAQKSSRADKDLTLSPVELKQRWQDVVRREEIAASVETAKALMQNSTDKELAPGEFVTVAYNAIHESESTFVRQDVVKIALELSRGQYTVADIDQAFYEALESGEIEHLRTHTNKKGLETLIYTSREMRQTEQEIVRTFDRHRQAFQPVFDPKVVKDAIAAHYGYFTDGQKHVVENILTSSARFTLIQGDAGTGKTSALEAVKQIIDGSKADRIIEIQGLGYTGKSAREIVNKAGIASQTLHRFLNEKQPEHSGNRKIWIVDEGSMVGSRQMKAVMDKAIEQDARVVFIGDGKQLQAISAGRMFKDLQQHDHVDTIRMEEALRQKSAYMKAVVSHVKEYQNGTSTTGIDEAFRTLKDESRVYRIPKRERRIEAAARHYIEHPDRPHCLVITPVNEDRVEINEIIHDTLKGQGQTELTVPIHTPVYLHGTAQYFAKNYTVGQKAFIEKSRIEGLKPGREVTVSGIDVEQNQITLASGKSEYTVDLKQNKLSLSVYDVAERSFFEGEKIVFLKNDKTLDLSNGQTATITKIGPEQVITAKIDGQERKATINLKFYPYVDRGYAVTVHKSQGQTAKDVVMVTDSKHPLNRTETLYVALSRAEDNFTLYGDSPDDLKVQFKEAQPKTSSLNLIQEMGPKHRTKSKSLER